jgi:RNA polymerase sigma-70 factor (ECF subfamily)
MFRHLEASMVEPIPSPVQLTDAELALAIKGQHPHAPAITWKRFAPLVRRIVRRSFGAEYDVEDLVQDIFMRLFGKIQDLREPGALRAYLVSITVLSIRHEIRRRKIRRIVGLMPTPALAELSVVPEDNGARQALTRFYAILERIGARERTAFVLRYVEEMADQEVADALGVSLATARRASAKAFERVSLHARNDPFLAELLPKPRPSP